MFTDKTSCSTHYPVLIMNAYILHKASTPVYAIISRYYISCSHIWIHMKHHEQVVYLLAFVTHSLTALNSNPSRQSQWMSNGRRIQTRSAAHGFDAHRLSPGKERDQDLYKPMHICMVRKLEQWMQDLHVSLWFPLSSSIVSLVCYNQRSNCTLWYICIHTVIYTDHQTVFPLASTPEALLQGPGRFQEILSAWFHRHQHKMLTSSLSHNPLQAILVWNNRFYRNSKIHFLKSILF